MPLRFFDSMKNYDFIYEKLNQRSRKKGERPRLHIPLPEREELGDRPEEEKEEENDRGVIVIEF